MTVRSRRSTQEGTGVFDPERRPARLETPPHGAALTAPGAAAPGEPWELVTEVTPRPVPVEQATPAELTARPERSEPLRVISMKDQAGGAMPRATAEPRAPLHVQLRTMAEVAGVREPAGLGRLAPPHDPRQARMRRRRADLAWGCLAVALAGGISLAIWLIAGR
jgi:hypothetical protein